MYDPKEGSKLHRVIENDDSILKIEKARSAQSWEVDHILIVQE